MPLKRRESANWRGLEPASRWSAVVLLLSLSLQKSDYIMPFIHNLEPNQENYATRRRCWQNESSCACPHLYESIESSLLPQKFILFHFKLFLLHFINAGALWCPHAFSFLSSSSARAIELFVQHLLNKASTHTQAKGAKSISCLHLYDLRFFFRCLTFTRVYYSI